LKEPIIKKGLSINTKGNQDSKRTDRLNKYSIDFDDVPSEQLQNELKQVMADGGQAARAKKGAVPEISLSKSVISESDQDEEEEEKISINGASPPA
jgi:hypothetical protein